MWNIRFLSFVIVLCVLASCNNTAKTGLPANVQSVDTLHDGSLYINYTEEARIHFMDSIGHLPDWTSLDHVSQEPDSVFRNRPKLDVKLSAADFAALKASIKKETMALDFMERVLPDVVLDSVTRSLYSVPIAYFPFDKSGYNAYAICVGCELDWGSQVYFFQQDKLIARHDIYHHYGLELEHYTASDGRTVIYYRENFESGTGIWQYNYFFYKFMEGELAPVLNVLSEGNLAYPSGRSYAFETEIVNKEPLTLKMNYMVMLADTGYEDDMIVDDTVTSVCDWIDGKLALNFGTSRLNDDKLLCYYVGDNNALFIYAYYNLLHGIVKGDNPRRKAMVLNFVNDVMNE